MLRILTDNHHVAVTLDNLALVADLFYRRLYFHSSLPPFVNLAGVHRLPVGGLFCTPGDPSLCRVVNGDLNGHLIARKDLDIVHSELAGYVCRNDHVVRQLYLEGCIRERFYDHALKFNYVILWQNLFLPLQKQILI